MTAQQTWEEGIDDIWGLVLAAALFAIGGYLWGMIL